MEQLDLFAQPDKTALITPGKPHKDRSVQPNGKVLYRGKIGWFQDKEIAIQFGYTPPQGFDHY